MNLVRELSFDVVVLPLEVPGEPVQALSLNNEL